MNINIESHHPSPISTVETISQKVGAAKANGEFKEQCLMQDRRPDEHLCLSAPKH